MTNFEKIKAMSIEKLAAIIMCPFDNVPDSCFDRDCNKCCKEWLESEVQEDDI